MNTHDDHIRKQLEEQEANVLRDESEAHDALNAQVLTGQEIRQRKEFKRQEKKRRKKEKKATHKIQYEKEMALIIIGGKDLHNETITNVYATSEDFAIYEVDDSGNPASAIKVHINTRKRRDKIHEERFNKIAPRYIEAKAILHKVENAKATRARIASIMNHALSLDEANAEVLFDKLIEDIEEEFNERISNKLAFLYSNIIISIVFASLSLWRYSYVIAQKHYVNFVFDAITMLLFILTCASIGGTFSLSYKLQKLATIRGVRWITYTLYGTERTFIAMSAGFIFFLATSAQLIFASIVNGQDHKQRLFTVLFLSVLAGFSETLVPDLLVTIEHKNRLKEEKTE